MCLAYGDCVVILYRLFLTMNSKYGEISRAMRNRGIELFILPEVCYSTHYTNKHFYYFSKDQLDSRDMDLAVLLRYNDIEDSTTATQLIGFHKEVVQLRRSQGEDFMSTTGIPYVEKLVMSKTHNLKRRSFQVNLALNFFHTWY